MLAQSQPPPDLGAPVVVEATSALSHVWGYDFDLGSNVVDLHIRYLRRKLGSDMITTVRGMGYRLDG